MAEAWRGFDISGAIGELPGGKSTENFSTPNASGSTSQAANIAEALEVGTSLLLVDEDTSATNFMIRDERMRELVEKEPISPFIDVVRPLHRTLGVSAVIVVGGVGDYLDVADRVILMEDYRPRDATERAAEIREKFPARTPLGEKSVQAPKPRRVATSSIDLRRGKRTTARGRGLRTVELGRERVDLTHLEQLAEAGQTEAIARIIGEFVGESKDLEVARIAEAAVFAIFENGLGTLAGFQGHPGELSLPRAQEISAALNRVRSLVVRSG